MERWEYVEQQYEKEFGEPWSALEARVRQRHPMICEIIDKARERQCFEPRISVDRELKRGYWDMFFLGMTTGLALPVAILVIAALLHGH